MKQRKTINSLFIVIFLIIALVFPIMGYAVEEIVSGLETESIAINEDDEIEDSKIEKSAYQNVKRVVDGDTIVLDNDEKIRLIGVDTPETVHPKKEVEYFGKEASAFTKSMCEGKSVRIEHDWQRHDKYGRTLAYIYLEDGTFINAEIIKQGYGFAYTRFPFKYIEEFRQYQREAMEDNRGLWEREKQSF